ncbi:MAG: hypothetical protein AB1635_21355 [Acidobacteriota bacterium]
MDHATAELLLADAAHGRLDDASREALARHVESCAECRAWADTYRFLQRSLVADAPDAGSHVASDQLARFALGAATLTAADRDEIARHVAGCGQCQAEVQLARAAVADARALPASPPAVVTAAPRRVPLALAAGFALAVLGAGALALQLRAAQSALDEARAWSGAVDFVLVGGPTRSNGARPTLRVPAGQPAAVMAVVIELPETLDPDAPVAMRLDTAAGAVAWALERPAGEVRRLLDANGVLLLHVPADRLADGEYTLVIEARAFTGEIRLVESRLTVDRVD